MKQNSNFNSLLNVSKGTTCKRLYNKEFGIIKDMSCLYLSLRRPTRECLHVKAWCQEMGDVSY